MALPKVLFNIVVINHKTTKFESNSQLYRLVRYCSRGCYQSQNYKFESNSQPVGLGDEAENSCYQSQNYKI